MLDSSSKYFFLSVCLKHDPAAGLVYCLVQSTKVLGFYALPTWNHSQKYSKILAQLKLLDDVGLRPFMANDLVAPIDLWPPQPTQLNQLNDLVSPKGFPGSSKFGHSQALLSGESQYLFKVQI